MARAIWNGAISFGLVNIPVKLYNAVARRSVSFRQLDVHSGSRVRQKRVRELDGAEVAYDDVVKGYEVSRDRFVVVRPEELEAFAPGASRTIEIEEFVDLQEIDPVFFDTSYQVAPGRTLEKAYALLVRAMADAGKVAIARFVMHTKQYLAVLRPSEGRLYLSTMVYADEIVPAEEVPELSGLSVVELSERELTIARALVSALSGPFRPEKYRDGFRDRVLELVERKLAGEEDVVGTSPAPASTPVVDLMAALEASLAEASQAKKRHPSSAVPSGTRSGATRAAGDVAVDPASSDDRARVRPSRRRRQPA